MVKMVKIILTGGLESGRYMETTSPSSPLLPYIHIFLIHRVVNLVVKFYIINCIYPLYILLLVLFLRNIVPIALVSR